jgi:hypothetical protein
MKAFTSPVLLLLAVTGWAGCAGSGAIANRPDAAHIEARANPSSPIGTTRDSTIARGTAFDVAVQNVSSPSGASASEHALVTRDVALVNHRYTVAEPPPIPESKPLHLRPIRPAREAVWIEGNWAYTGNPSSPYEWMSGHWEIPPPGGRAWVPSAWQRTGNKYVYVRGHWR